MSILEAIIYVVIGGVAYGLGYAKGWLSGSRTIMQRVNKRRTRQINK